ncbi:MAG: hypothetical protein EB060_09990 [Proteobacteria bacterium]|nr:hypothetical protein [Pseudomonadota bacterium]
MNKLIRISGVVVASAALCLGYATAKAATQTETVNATFITPLSFSGVTAINFGRVALNGTNAEQFIIDTQVR